jgi:hypothetical protein
MDELFGKVDGRCQPNEMFEFIKTKLHVTAFPKISQTNLFTTSIEWRDISIFTSTLKYSVMCLQCINFSSTSTAINGLFSTSSGNWNRNLKWRRDLARKRWSAYATIYLSRSQSNSVYELRVVFELVDQLMLLRLSKHTFQRPLHQ